MVYTKRFAVAKKQGWNGASKVLAVIAVAVSSASVLFAAASFRASNSYKKEMEEAKTSSRTEIDALRTEASKLAKDKAQLEEAQKYFTFSDESLRADNARLTRQNMGLDQDKDQLTKLNGSVAEELESLKETTAKLLQQATDRNTKLKDELQVAQSELDESKEREEEASKKPHRVNTNDAPSLLSYKLAAMQRMQAFRRQAAEDAMKMQTGFASLQAESTRLERAYSEESRGIARRAGIIRLALRWPMPGGRTAGIVTGTPVRETILRRLRQIRRRLRETSAQPLDPECPTTGTRQRGADCRTTIRRK